MEIPYTVNPRRDTGLFNSKVGIWLFLASEVMLFGGLFSAYVFLRTGVRQGIDLPWPDGLEVHGWMYWIGFINTLILIASSVFVVMAWAQLKLRNYGKYQMYMVGVLVCSAIFMVNKGYEYNSKLNHHFGIFLTDGTLIDGELHTKANGVKGDEVVFKAKEVDLALVRTGVFGKPDPYFLDFAVNKDLKYSIQLHKPEMEDGKLIFVPGEVKEDVPATLIPQLLDVHMAELETAAKEDAVRRKKLLREELKDAEGKERIALKRQLQLLRPIAVPSKVVGTPSEPSDFIFKRKEVLGGRLGKESISFYQGNGMRGQMVDDSVEVLVHTLDFQMVRDDLESMAWNDEIWTKGEGAAMKDGYLKHKVEIEDRYRDHIDHGFFPSNKLYRWSGAHVEHHPKDETGGEAAHGEYSIVAVQGEDIRRMGSHGPKFGPYYAIYFTMTALHGLHVVGGALVLGYFCFFGRKLYKKNPEHLANRVEVGGLFWHFVDLVWIFLFPLFYLL